MRNIELFFRGEFWLHFATMFFCMIVLMRILHLPLSILLAIPCIVGVLWECIWKKYRGNPISLSDAFGTALGGAAAVFAIYI